MIELKAEVYMRFSVCQKHFESNSEEIYGARFQVDRHDECCNGIPEYNECTVIDCHEPSAFDCWHHANLDLSKVSETT